MGNWRHIKNIGDSYILYLFFNFAMFFYLRFLIFQYFTLFSSISRPPVCGWSPRLNARTSIPHSLQRRQRGRTSLSSQTLTCISSLTRSSTWPWTCSVTLSRWSMTSPPLDFAMSVTVFLLSFLGRLCLHASRFWWAGPRMRQQSRLFGGRWV